MQGQAWSQRGRWVGVALWCVTVLPVSAARVPAADKSLPEADVVTSAGAAPPADIPTEPTFAKQAPAELRDVIRDVLASPGLRGALVGMHAVRLADGAPLFSLHADEPLNPASCVKLFTTATALKVLKPRYRFSTEFLARGNLDQGVLKGDLIIRGNGDPTLTPQRLYKIAAELQDRGLDQVAGDIVLDDSYFDAVPEPPGWEQETLADRAYAAPNGALSLGQNALSIYVRPGPTRRSPATVQVEPANDLITVQTGAVTTRYGRRLWVRSVPDGDRTRVLVQGGIGVNEPAEKFMRRIAHPAMHLGSSFLRMLEARGVKVKGRVRLGTTPETAKALWTELSVSLREIVTQLNHHSSNFVAEMLLKAVGAAVYGAPGTTQKGILAVQDVMERDVGIPRSSYIMGNGSGLNDVNRFTAAQLTQLLRHMALDPQLGPDFITSLAVAGNTGTLAHRMGQTGADGMLRGKTGTLQGVSALSGWAHTAAYGPVVFSFMVNGLPGPASTAWEMQDRVALGLVGDFAGAAWNRKGPAVGMPEDAPGGGGP